MCIYCIVYTHSVSYSTYSYIILLGIYRTYLFFFRCENTKTLFGTELLYFIAYRQAQCIDLSEHRVYFFTAMQLQCTYRNKSEKRIHYTYCSNIIYWMYYISNNKCYSSFYMEKTRLYYNVVYIFFFYIVQNMYRHCVRRQYRYIYLYSAGYQPTDCRWNKRDIKGFEKKSPSPCPGLFLLRLIFRYPLKGPSPFFRSEMVLYKRRVRLFRDALNR